MEFEKLYFKAKRHKMELPQSVLAFKLLDGTLLEHKDRQLVLTAVNYSDIDNLFKQMKSALKKFFGEQSMPSMKTEERNEVKHEPTFVAQHEENVNASYHKRNTSQHGSRGHRPYNQRGAFRGRNRAVRKQNPTDIEGNLMTCNICQSVMHFSRDCPHSYENIKKKDSTHQAVLFTGESKELSVLLCESINSAILDSGCSSTVAGKDWIKWYLDSLNDSDRKEVYATSSDTVFKSGGGEKRTSLQKLTLPCYLAGNKCSIETDVIESDIPLLMSKTAMKKAGMKLDLLNDKAEIFGREVLLQNTSSGHHSVPLNNVEVPIEQCLFSNCSALEKEKRIVKLHKQFAHPPAHRLKALLKEAGLYDNDCGNLLDKLSMNCDTCLRFKKTPSRPVVALPVATEFNEVVVLDLKEWEKGKVWFLHLIDAATRFTLSTIITNKRPSTIIQKVMTLWIGSGFGVPKKFLADNGGEFANEEYRDMCGNLNIDVKHTAAYSPWQNGLCERNHAVIDSAVSKLLQDNKSLSLEVALVWAIHAKNCLHMNSGYSLYQLVFGRNPNLPNVLVDKPPALQGSTISKVFAEHINTLHSSRQAFIKSESSEKIRRALRHQIRVKNQLFTCGDSVYYKRDGEEKWRGPGKVIGQDGKVIFVRHGNIYVRVSPCRLIKKGEEFSKNDEVMPVLNQSKVNKTFVKSNDTIQQTDNTDNDNFSNSADEVTKRTDDDPHFDREVMQPVESTVSSHTYALNQPKVEPWRSGSVLASRPEGRGFDPRLCCLFTVKPPLLVGRIN